MLHPEALLGVHALQDKERRVKEFVGVSDAFVAQLQKSGSMAGRSQPEKLHAAKRLVAALILRDMIQEVRLVGLCRAGQKETGGVV